MRFYAALMLLPMLVYCLAQTYRDARRRSWIFAAWGGAMILCLGWIIEGLTRGPSY